MNVLATAPKWPTPRITHIGLNVTSLERAIDFYTTALGMKVMKSAEGRFATMSFGYQHHDIALIPARSPRGKAELPVGVNHICFEMPTYDDWVLSYGRLIDSGISVERVIDHRTGLGCYFRDPDGNALEVWCENFPTMEEAISFGTSMAEEFEENHIGYPIDTEQLYRDYAERKSALLGSNRPE